MGSEESRAEFAKVKNSMNAINSIYAMFEQSNQVVLATLKQRNPRLSRYRIKNVEHIL